MAGELRLWAGGLSFDTDRHGPLLLPFRIHLAAVAAYNLGSRHAPGLLLFTQHADAHGYGAARRPRSRATASLPARRAVDHRPAPAQVQARSFPSAVAPSCPRSRPRARSPSRSSCHRGRRSPPASSSACGRCGRSSSATSASRWPRAARRPTGACRRSRRSRHARGPRASVAGHWHLSRPREADEGGRRVRVARHRAQALCLLRT